MIRVHILCVALLTVLVAGCYENGTKEDCVGLSCGPGLDWPDGGEASIRYVRYPDGTEWRAFIAFFIDTQTPETIDSGALNHCYRDPGFDADARHFYDVGDSITFHMPTGEDMQVPKVTGPAAVDFSAREFDVAYLRETWNDSNDPIEPEFFNNTSSVTADDGSMPAVIDSIYMPPQLDILAPQPGDGGFVTIQKGQDLEVEWANLEPVPPEISTAAAILFIDPSAAVYPIICFGLNSGHYLIPADIIKDIPANGLLQAGTVANEAVLTPDGRRIDTWATNCSAVPYTVVE
jgi:hypothetical protein